MDRGSIPLISTLFSKRARKKNKHYKLILKNIEKFYRKNQQIRAGMLRVIDENGNQLGILPREQAFSLAREKRLDIVEISPLADPPVAKITDYGKFLYDLQKKEKETRRNSKQSEVKSVRLGFAASPHDMEIRVRQGERFLQQGHKVKLDMILHGREMAHQDIAKKKFESILEMFLLPIKIEQELRRQGRAFSMVISSVKPSPHNKSSQDKEPVKE